MRGDGRYMTATEKVTSQRWSDYEINYRKSKEDIPEDETILREVSVTNRDELKKEIDESNLSSGSA